MSHEIVIQGFLMKKQTYVSASKAEEIRNQNISNQIWAGLQSAILGGGGAASLQDSISKGFREGKQHVENLENGIEYKSEYFQYGDPESLARIAQIEADPNFDKWLDDITIEDIKNSIRSSDLLDI
jgi:hypothetical protein